MTAALLISQWSLSRLSSESCALFFDPGDLNGFTPLARLFGCPA